MDQLHPGMEDPPLWQVDEWLNTDDPITLEALRGNVVVMSAFQMLCPGCVSHSIPQMQRLEQAFRNKPVQVLALHTVFEHHDAMNPQALRAFLHEYRVGFPVGVDSPGRDGQSIPQTMQAYHMRGTPTTLIFDAEGRLRRQAFGAFDDLLLGAEIGMLLAEVKPTAAPSATGSIGPGCAEDYCQIA